ncbi:MAG: hypothetical protein SangKO_075940 [Sandaracinaceae bacterium]
MPRRDVLARVPHNASLNQLLRQKHRWGVSLAALLYATNAHGLHTEWHHRKLVVSMSKRGWRTEEPKPMEGTERSEVMTQVLQSLREEGKGAMWLCGELGWSSQDLSDLVFGLTPVSVPGRAQSSGRPAGKLRLAAESGRVLGPQGSD